MPPKAYQEGYFLLNSVTQPFGVRRNPVVSIAIPFFNAGRCFGLAIQSVFSQTFEDWELILLDDGSNDASVDLPRRLKDPRVRFYSDGQNLRLARRLNQAAELARGKYLFRMDADDIMHPQRIEAQLNVLQGLSQNTVVGTAAYSIDDASTVVGLRPALPGSRTGYAARHSFIHPTVAASTEWFRKNPYSAEPVFWRSEDAELWCRTAHKSEFRWIQQPLLFYRESGVFNLANYVGSVEGRCELARRLEMGRFSRVRHLAAERTKVSVARVLHSVGASDFWVQHRFRAMERREISEANRIIEQIQSCPLPLS